ncbi:MAG: hypothetical protein CMK74_05350 [Pseudomonadales bacterium]|mgnify:CR=1 FL=1|nr:hypothetical protein [Pseudomonadales bacterium]|tara:strand:- start:1311 stop:1937 length:627 start_codon:yes stop_codon:yes gene_type:complete
MTDIIDLELLPQLAELFKWFNTGKHLNRISEPALWAELERQQPTYTQLFHSLGYQLCTDGRGFAWFHSDEPSPTINTHSRQLALLCMVLFDTQADAGKALNRFTEWRIDRPLLESAFEQHQELLTAEDLDVDKLQNLLEKATLFGFARSQPGYWELLPAVFRYLDHFQALAEHTRQNRRELEEPGQDETTNLGAIDHAAEDDNDEELE